MVSQIKRVKMRVKIFRELLHYFGERKIWWLVPLVVILGLIAVILVVESATGIAPFIYTFI
ncbi:hypothetical protein HY030_02115 [Candidatus Gottesmanbacteria bacterium]|nr:hypothetical protein [Candidatus Gottesmanbacteria bacterium]